MRDSKSGRAVGTCGKNQLRVKLVGNATPRETRADVVVVEAAVVGSGGADMMAGRVNVSERFARRSVERVHLLGAAGWVRSTRQGRDTGDTSSQESDRVSPEGLLRRSASRTVRHPPSKLGQVYDLGGRRRRVFLAMEYVEGRDLTRYCPTMAHVTVRGRKRIHSVNRRSSNGCPGLLSNRLRGTCLHGAGILNCDLKPTTSCGFTSGRVWISAWPAVHAMTRGHGRRAACGTRVHGRGAGVRQLAQHRLGWYAFGRCSTRR